MQVSEVESKVSVRVTVLDVEQAYQRLLTAGCQSRYTPMKTPELEEMACVGDADGHAVVLWRALNEDEWGFVPERLSKANGRLEAEDLLKRLLSHVPALFACSRGARPRASSN